MYSWSTYLHLASKYILAMPMFWWYRIPLLASNSCDWDLINRGAWDTWLNVMSCNYYFCWPMTPFHHWPTLWSPIPIPQPAISTLGLLSNGYSIRIKVQLYECMYVQYYINRISSIIPRTLPGYQCCVLYSCIVLKYYVENMGRAWDEANTPQLLAPVIYHNVSATLYG